MGNMLKKAVSTVDKVLKRAKAMVGLPKKKKKVRKAKASKYRSMSEPGKRWTKESHSGIVYGSRDIGGLDSFGRPELNIKTGGSGGSGMSPLWGSKSKKR